MTDPIDVLRSHVQSVALLERPHTDPADLVAAITGAGAPDIANRSTGADRSNVVALRCSISTAGGWFQKLECELATAESHFPHIGNAISA